MRNLPSPNHFCNLCILHVLAPNCRHLDEKTFLFDDRSEVFLWADAVAAAGPLEKAGGIVISDDEDVRPPIRNWNRTAGTFRTSSLLSVPSFAVPTGLCINTRYRYGCLRIKHFYSKKLTRILLRQKIFTMKMCPSLLPMKLWAGHLWKH